MNRDDLVTEMEEAICELSDVTSRIDGILDKMEEGIAQRARAYWYASLVCLQGNDHGYLAKEMCTMADTLEELYEKEQEEFEANND